MVNFLVVDFWEPQQKGGENESSCPGCKLIDVNDRPQKVGL
jgi:hypothetical protein